MKRFLWLLLFGALTYTISSCNASATATASNEPSVVQDEADLLAALQSAGATTELGDSITQDFFSVDGRLITINGTDGIQVFEYENAEAMESDAAQVAPDGGSIGRSMVTWMDAPHFYKAGRMIVLYIGKNETVLGLLEKAMGKQFAGR